MAKKLRLLADSYDQPQKDDDPAQPQFRRLVAFVKGDEFTPLSDEEHDRLVESGAAEDPSEVEKREREQLERRHAELQAERDRIDADLKSTKT